MSSERRPFSLFGTRLAHYRVDALIGAGGMGEVYRAHDTRLGRDVAIKMLPSAFAGDADRVSRLEREARALASLKHPNIAAIYGIEDADGGRALVLELVDGQTLSEHLRAERLAVAEAIRLAGQIAAALEAAHDKGIVHRDLKPANIKITPEGVIKVLDFGLAKAVPNGSGLDHPATTVDATREGMILGTLDYMSPEQARGRPVDKQIDVWAFGCVLYEMLSGRRPFAGETAADTLAAIIGSDPDWERLPAETPEHVRALLLRCLAKEPRQRLRDIRDARIQLTEPRAAGATSASHSRAVISPTRRWRWQVPAAATVVAALVAVGAWSVYRLASSPGRDEPPLQLTDFTDSVVMPSLSHDGRMLTFVRGVDFGRTAPTSGRIYVKMLPEGEPVELTSGEGGGGYPTFSPDDSRIVYTRVIKGSWDSWEVPVLGGTPQLFLPNASGLTWLNDKRLLYSSIKSGMHMGIVASAPSRSDARDIYFPDNLGGMAHRTSPSPDDRALLVVEMIRAVWQPCRLVPADGSSPGRPVGPTRGQCTSAAWSPDGRWMYFSSNAGGAFHIWRQRYPDGTPEQLTFGPTQQEGTAVTPDGRHLITSMGLERASIRLRDGAGERELTEEGYVTWPTMDPTGARVYYLKRTEGTQGQNSGELWVTDLASRRHQGLFPELLMAHYALSGDGRRVVFTTIGRQGGDGIWVADLDRRTPPRQLTAAGEPRAFFGGPEEIVFLGSDGRLRRMRDDGTAQEVVSPEPVVYLMTVSPDGLWAAVIAASATDGGGTRVEFRPLRGGEAVVVCDDACRGIGPASVRYGLPFSWSLSGSRLVVNLGFLAGSSQRAVALPYRSGEPLDQLWPSGLKTGEAVVANPGAQVLGEQFAFPAAADPSVLTWRSSFQSNLYRIRLPE
jgi:eukaryotic-like serine/threonine-protein kinase